MYQVIARKYRPQTFDELIGQEHVQKTLTNAIEQQPHRAWLYLFGPARNRQNDRRAHSGALPELHQRPDGARPAACARAASKSRPATRVDVIEIDAASNRGINEMREMRENVRYRPARDRYKVFIVDEAHQITNEAFNALLKTLEEPPEWVVFILCTTEAHEIPNTIASRCQHFSFRSVDFAELDRAHEVHRRAGRHRGRRRSAVGDRAGGRRQRARFAFGARSGDRLLRQDAARRGCPRAARHVRRWTRCEQSRKRCQNSDGARDARDRAGTRAQRPESAAFLRELSRYWRNLLVAKIAGKTTRLIAASDAEQQRIAAKRRRFSAKKI